MTASCAGHEHFLNLASWRNVDLVGRAPEAEGPQTPNGATVLQPTAPSLASDNVVPTVRSRLG